MVISFNYARGVLLTLLLCWCYVAAAQTPAVALYYGDKPPWNALRAFDVVVVDPDHPDISPQSHQHVDSQLFAYVSVGEVQSSRSWFKALPKSWLIGKNKAWGADVIDQSAPSWPKFFVDKVIAPLWQQGYRGFFLDTLDSWQLVAKTPAEKAQQRAGLVAVIRAIKARFPDARLIFNRGFEILPQVHNLVWMLAAESLFQGYDANNKQYKAVSAEDRNWLLQKLKQAHNDYQLPILAIDYVPLGKRLLARETAKKIRHLGFIPWVTTHDLDTLGVGQVEAVPRKVLVLYNASKSASINEAQVQRLLGIHFAYLGLVPDYVPITGQPPDKAVDRYAGAVIWLQSDKALNDTVWPDWLAQQSKLGLPLAFFGSLGVSSSNALMKTLHLHEQDLPESPHYTLASKAPMMGFEMPIYAQQDSPSIEFTGKGKPLLTLATDTGQKVQPAALTSWGGYALDPYVEYSVQHQDNSDRWLINPLLFLRAALKLDPQVPVPDLSTETGRRLLFIHIDGDGFANRVETPGNDFSGRALLDFLKQQTPWPTTMSVIEGEVGPDGLYPKLSPQLEAIARQIFALPNVEIGSHTYSHAFNWREAEKDAKYGQGDQFHLAIKGYHFSTRREIIGSRDYINSQLAPAGKRVRILQWPGDCIAPIDALRTAQSAGLLNINGGDTTLTRSSNSWTQMAGIGVQKGGYFQVFAPNQNEMLYTNDWHGPYWGFKRVLETYELTNTPYRFKPVDLYFHTYLLSKAAGLASLKSIYQWIGKHQWHPIFTSEYIRKVLDYNQMVIARTPNGYRVRGTGELHNLRISKMPKAQRINWRLSQHLVGKSPAAEGIYLSFQGKEATIALTAKSNKATKLPYLLDANANVTHFERQSRHIGFGLKGHMPIEFSLTNAQHCAVTTGDKTLQPVRTTAHATYYRMTDHVAPTLELQCRP